MRRRHGKRARLGGVLLAALGALALLALPSVAAAKDRNHDRIPDRWEKRHHLSLKVKQAARDQDRDQLRNRAEFLAGDDPRDSDSDDDGVDGRRRERRHDRLVRSRQRTARRSTCSAATRSAGIVNGETRIECDEDEDHHSEASASHDGEDNSGPSDNSGPGGDNSGPNDHADEPEDHQGDQPGEDQASTGRERHANCTTLTSSGRGRRGGRARAGERGRHLRGGRAGRLATWRRASPGRRRCRPPAAGRAGTAAHISRRTSSAASSISPGGPSKSSSSWICRTSRVFVPASRSARPAADHRHLDDVGGGALDHGVDGEALAEAAGVGVARAQLRDRAAAAHQRRHVALLLAARSTTCSRKARTAGNRSR